MNIREIAQLAGVSPATISLVINNKPGVSDTRRAEIKKLLDRYGYERKHSKSRGNVLFVRYSKYGTVVEHNGDFINRVIDGLQDESEKLCLSITMRSLSTNSFGDIFQLFENGNFDGAIVLGTELDDEFAAQLVKAPVPIVVLDNLVENYNLDSVVMDNRTGTYLAVSHLIECGHKRIGYVHSKFDISNFRHRYEGYKMALKTNGLILDSQIIFEVEPTMHGAYRDMLSVLSKKKELPTALFADNDTIGVGVCKAMKQYNYKLPADVSIIGFDDLPFCMVSEPALTTMSIAKEEMGRLAVRRMNEKIHNNNTVIKQMILPQLVKRESVRILTY